MIDIVEEQNKIVMTKKNLKNKATEILFQCAVKNIKKNNNIKYDDDSFYLTLDNPTFEKQTSLKVYDPDVGPYVKTHIIFSWTGDKNKDPLEIAERELKKVFKNNFKITKFTYEHEVLRIF